MSIFQSHLPPAPFPMTPWKADPTQSAADGVLRFHVGPIHSDHVAAFRRATRTESFAAIPPTFATYFRWAEFHLLERLSVDMARLLHTEQEYEFRSPLTVGGVLEVESKVASDRERRGLRFLTLSTMASAGGTIKLVATSSFVVRGGEGA